MSESVDEHYLVKMPFDSHKFFVKLVFFISHSGTFTGNYLNLCDSGIMFTSQIK